MKTCFLWLCGIILFPLLSLSQVAPYPPGQSGPVENWSWSVNPIATGQASGHIADITLKNTTSSDATFTSGPLVIPSEGTYQIELHVGQYSVTVPKGKEVTIPIDGYCSDVFKPTAPKGTILPTPVTPTPEQVILIDHLNNIIKAADKLMQDGAFTASFSGNPEKEREMVIQHTFWIHTSSIQGKPYGYTEICENVELQFNSIMHDPVWPDGILQESISQLWDAIVKTGTEAKIPAFLPTPFPPEVLITPQMPAPVFPEIVNMITATGTGRTTGHIADLTVFNPTDKPKVFTFGPGSEPFDGKPVAPGQPIPTGPPCFIPSSGQYQPYIVPSLGPVLVDPGQSFVFPVIGFCVDIHRPPVPSGTEMPTVSEWITLPTGVTPGGITSISPADGGILSGGNGTAIIVVPTTISLSLEFGIEALLNTRPAVFKPTISGSQPANPSTDISGVNCIPIINSITPTIPGTTIPLNVTVDPEKFPTVAVPLLIDAIDRISNAYDQSKDKGIISTPFSGNPEKEREAVIQQTFWLYASALTDSKYGKDDFKGQTVRQFENNTGSSLSNAQPSQQDKINQGVDDFWDTFEAVGVQAKILSVPVPVPSIPSPGVQKGWETYSTKQAKILD